MLNSSLPKGTYMGTMVVPFDWHWGYKEEGDNKMFHFGPIKFHWSFAPKPKEPT